MPKKSTGTTFSIDQADGKSMINGKPGINNTMTAAKQGAAEMSSTKKDTAMTSVLKPRHDA